MLRQTDIPLLPRKFKIDKRGDFDFDIVNFLDGDVPRRPSYSVYIYLKLFALLEHIRMLLTSIIVTNS